MKRKLSWGEVIRRNIYDIIFFSAFGFIFGFYGFTNNLSWVRWFWFSMVILFWVTIWLRLKKAKRTPVIVCFRCQMELERDWKGCPKCLIEIKNE